MSADERDPVVAEALATIDVPEHGPGFWARLEAAMGATEEPASIAVVAPPTPATSVFAADVDAADAAADPAPRVQEVVLDGGPPAEPIARRWGRRGARALLAAAAVAVVAVAGVLVARRDDTGPDLSSETVGSTVPGDTATTVPGVPAPEAQIVIEYVDALGRGDIDAAASLLGPRSTGYLEAIGIPLDEFLGMEVEATGVWSTATDRSVTVVDGVSVVLLEGTVERDGVAKADRLAIPVVYAESTQAWFVDPWAFDPDVEDQGVHVIRPEPADGVALPAGEPVEVAFAEPGTAYFSVDGASVTAVPTTDGLVGHAASWTVPAGTPDGATIVIAFQSETGKSVYAQAVPVSAG
jgi:hypothetical protein